MFRLLLAVLAGKLSLAACQIGGSPEDNSPTAAAEPTGTEAPSNDSPSALPTETVAPTDSPSPEVTPMETPAPETPAPETTPTPDPTQGDPGGGDNAPTPGTGSLAIGAAPPMTSFNHNMRAATKDMESKVGHLQTRREYRQWNEDWASYVSDDKANGRLPVISVKPPQQAPGGWNAVASGSVDQRIRDQATELASFDTPIYLTFHHEPENDAPQQSAAFRAAQIHFYDVVKSVAPSLQIGPTLMAYTARGGSGRNVNDWLAPDDKMDFVAWDGYNFNGPGSKTWQTPAQVFDKPLAVNTAHEKPTLISEIGINGHYDGPQGQSPVQWLRDALAYARDKNVVALCYFNTGSTAKENSVIMTPPMEDVFRQALGS
ncbi:MAG TPA: hypothetical protein VLR26_05755 [Frankiaceae bacterium]|nr:hypothetical protein [Frankiaceae bacterium]